MNNKNLNTITDAELQKINGGSNDGLWTQIGKGLGYVAGAFAHSRGGLDKNRLSTYTGPHRGFY